MAHINELKAILKEITLETITIGRIKDSPTGVYISPSDFINSLTLEEVYFYDVILKKELLIDLETAQTKFLRCKTNIDFDYNDFDSRGYISVDNGLEFTVNDEIWGTTSGAGGTIYRIQENTLYLKDVLNFEDIGYIPTTDGTDFEILDEIVGSTSDATGTVYKIDTNNVYIH